MKKHDIAVNINTPAEVDIHVNDLLGGDVGVANVCTFDKATVCTGTIGPPRTIGDVRLALAAPDARRPVDPTFVLHPGFENRSAVAIPASHKTDASQAQEAQTGTAHCAKQACGALGKQARPNLLN
jgi:hypothetical protein